LTLNFSLLLVTTLHHRKRGLLYLGL